MNPVLAAQLEQVLAEARDLGELGCEDQLRVAAGTLSHAADGEISSISVVGSVAADQRSRLQTVVAGIAEALGVDPTVCLADDGAFCVRFVRRPAPTAGHGARPPAAQVGQTDSALTGIGPGRNRGCLECNRLATSRNRSSNPRGMS